MDSERIVVIVCVLNVPLIVVCIISNVLVLAAIRRTPSLRSEPSTVFLASLAVSDLIIGLVVQPVVITECVHPGNTVISHARTILPTLFGVISLSTMAIVSVDGFFALHYHLRYADIITFRRALFTSASVWIVLFLLTGISFWKLSIYFLTSAVIILICILISIFSYANIYRIVCHHHSQISGQQHAVTNVHSEQNRNMAKAKRNIKNTFIFHILRILGYSPVLIYMVILATSSEPSKEWILAETLAYLNSAINPFLFCWRIRELRESVFKMMKKILRKENGTNEVAMTSLKL